jgi:uncharacterized protein YacL
MSDNNSEIERLRRLRQQQLAARDPHAKQRDINRKVSARRRKLKKQGAFQDMLTDMAYKWKGVIVGALIGIIISIVLSLTVEAWWVELAGLAAVIVLASIGLILGQAFDAREELKYLIDD